MRNPLEDTIGMYEVIRRMTFQMCQQESFETKSTNKSFSSENPTVYTFLGGHPLKKSKSEITAASWEHLMSKQEFLNFYNRKAEPQALNNSNIDIAHYDNYANNTATGNIANYSNGCEVGVFFAGTDQEKSIQTKIPHATRNKWYHSFCLCCFDSSDKNYVV